MTIVWDVDDVLNDLMRSWFAHTWLPARPGCTLRYEDLVDNPPDRVLGVSRAQYLASLDQFRLSPEAAVMRPRSEFLRWFERHGHRHRHLALTSRPLTSVPAASQWVFQHFGRWIRTLAYVPTRPDDDFPGYDRTKADFLRWLDNADILVDDNPENIDAANALGIRSFLVAQPWNDAVDDTEELLVALTAATGVEPNPATQETP